VAQLATEQKCRDVGGKRVVGSVCAVLDVADVMTDRLRLTAITPHDPPELFAIMSDPSGWWYEPAGRHAELQTTIEFCDWVAAMWLADGLCYWTARRLSPDELVGLGGARRHRDRTWNLSYRIATGHQGQGLATGLSRAAHDAAMITDPAVAFIAWVDEPNTASRRVAERIGLTNEGPRFDSSDGEIRLAYSDRPLDRPPREHSCPDESLTRRQPGSCFSRRAGQAAAGRSPLGWRRWGSRPPLGRDIGKPITSAFTRIVAAGGSHRARANSSLVRPRGSAR
jgi:ribosomal-protein-alanine N-acetyltransferase